MDQYEPVNPDKSAQNLHLELQAFESFPSWLDNLHACDSTNSSFRMIYYGPRRIERFQYQPRDENVFCYDPAETRSASHERVEKFLIGRMQGTARLVQLEVATQERQSFGGPVLLVIFFGLYALLAKVYRNRAQLLHLARQKLTWFALASAIMYIALSGSLHTLLQGSSLFYFHPSHGLYLVHPSGSHQFGGEGLFFGAASFAASGAVFGIAEVLPFVRTWDDKSKVAQACGFAFFAAYMLTFIVFAMKHPWFIHA